MVHAYGIKAISHSMSHCSAGYQHGCDVVIEILLHYATCNTQPHSLNGLEQKKAKNNNNKKKNGLRKEIKPFSSQ